ncbi:hypothetical protein ACMAUO_12670 [Gluconacetobacter sp. Hr-1-5]|uniref:hypothetical protein n=1 Tax=Gluconacetobacter sp. Hr-1-5 TaxID=3395370 RepID=UPI003B520DC5
MTIPPASDPQHAAPGAAGQPETAWVTGDAKRDFDQEIELLMANAVADLEKYRAFCEESRRAMGRTEAVRVDAARMRCHAGLSTEQAVRMWAIERVSHRIAFGKGRENDLFAYADILVGYIMEGQKPPASPAEDAA